MSKSYVHPETGHESAVIRRRRRLALSVTVMCATVSTAGLLAAAWVKSPEQVRAEASVPAPSILTAPVERRVLASTLVTRGSVVSALKIEITPVVAEAATQVVTAVNVTAGDDVRPGTVLVAVSGRPVIALDGKVPAYRDLKPGDSGVDVKQLQGALKALGHYGRGDRPGFFGTATKAAIRRLYIKLGYDVPDTGGLGGAGDRAALAAARDNIDVARQALDSLKRRIAAGEELEPTAEPWSQQLARLEDRLKRAVNERADLVSRTGPKLPLAEFVFVPDFPARVTAIGAKVGDRVPTPLITLAVGELAVLAKVRPAQALLLRPGMPAQLASETLGLQSRASVTHVGELTAEPADKGGAPYHAVTIVASEPLKTAWADLDVRVTIVSARTEADVLVVPLSAVSASADGRTTVSVLGPAQQVTRVEVHAGLSGDGFVEVRPLADGLVEGDRVVVSGPP